MYAPLGPPIPGAKDGEKEQRSGGWSALLQLVGVSDLLVLRLLVPSCLAACHQSRNDKMKSKDADAEFRSLDGRRAAKVGEVAVLFATPEFCGQTKYRDFDARLDIIARLAFAACAAAAAAGSGLPVRMPVYVAVPLPVLLTGAYWRHATARWGYTGLRDRD